jgi:Peptidase family M41
VRNESIIPRGQALGVTLATSESDRYSYRHGELVAKIKVALGGARRRNGRVRRLDYRRRVGHPRPDASSRRFVSGRLRHIDR